MTAYAPVDFALVRYSPVEGAHYFYDPAYPTAIQFLLNGQWEPWDVSYVKYKAQDPEIRRIAHDAEARLVRDNTVPGYQCWPSAPPPGGPVTGAPAPSYDETESPLHSPASLIRDSYSATPPDQSRSLQLQRPPPGPEVHAPPPVNPPPPVARPHVQPQPLPPAQKPHYTSPYGSDPPPHSPYSHAPGPSAPAPAHPVLHLNTNVPSTHHPAPPETASHDHHPSSAVVPLVVPSKRRETKILLSLDGDGVRGLSQALLVESLVNAICTKIGAQIEPYQVFDLIGGCSMGGVLSIMLSRLRMQAHRAREAYTLVAKAVYPNKREFFTSFDPHAPPKDDNAQAVEDIIRTIVEKEVGSADELFLDPRDDSVNVPLNSFVVTTQINIGTNKPGLIRSFSTRRITGPELDGNMTIWQAMRATTIAPRYMLPRDGVNWRPVIEPGLVDHGTAKNNPIRDIRFECSKLYRYGNDTMVIVSIGTGAGLDRQREVPEIVKSVHDRTLEATVFAEKFEADHQALMERGWMKYFRFNVDLSGVPLEEWCNEELVREKTSTYLARPDIGQMFYACVDAITTVLLSGNMGRDAVPPSY